MLAETRAFFRELLEQDLSATNLVDSDFAMLNQRLAEHYGIAGVDGLGDPPGRRCRPDAAAAGS